MAVTAFEWCLCRHSRFDLGVPMPDKPMNAEERGWAIAAMGLQSDILLAKAVAAQITGAEREAKIEGYTQAKRERAGWAAYLDGFSAARDKAAGIAERTNILLRNGNTTIAKAIRAMEPDNE